MSLFDPAEKSEESARTYTSLRLEGVKRPRKARVTPLLNEQIKGLMKWNDDLLSVPSVPQ